MTPWYGANLKYELDLVQIELLIVLINKQSVLLRDKNDYEDAVKWCEENIGECRLYHPMAEAEEGYIDYFEGEWAVSFPSKQKFFDGEIVISFWFARNQDKMQFALMFG